MAAALAVWGRPGPRPPASAIRNTYIWLSAYAVRFRFQHRQLWRNSHNLRGISLSLIFRGTARRRPWSNDVDRVTLDYRRQLRIRPANRAVGRAHDHSSPSRMGAFACGG